MLENFALIKKKINLPILSTYSITIPKAMQRRNKTMFSFGTTRK